LLKLRIGAGLGAAAAGAPAATGAGAGAAAGTFVSSIDAAQVATQCSFWANANVAESKKSDSFLMVSSDEVYPNNLAQSRGSFPADKGSCGYWSSYWSQ
jgi:hypothetical protein